MSCIKGCLWGDRIWEGRRSQSNTATFPEKYKIRFGDTQVDLEESLDNPVYTQPNTMLLKEPFLYCFLLRCKKPKAEPFMEWVVETVLPQEVRKLASAIEEEDHQIHDLAFANEKKSTENVET